MLALRLTTRTLWLQVVLALAYAIPTLLLGTITGSPALDGLVGGLLGLSICSLPARNTVDALFADRFALRRIYATWAGKRWLALNGLVLLAGWGVIWLGMVSLVGA
jgi:hypothetical protein